MFHSQRSFLTSGLWLTLGICLLAGAARADDPPALAGRVSYVEGTVSFHTNDQAQWAFAGINYPVTSGESFWTEPDARDEIQIGSSVVRMDNSTELGVLKLDSTITQLQLDQGIINYRVIRNDPDHPIEIETPHGAVSLTQPGTYRIEAGSDTMPTVVATLEGEARFIGPHSYLDIQAGEQATAIGDPVSYTMAEAVTTPFDDWALQRDARENEQHGQTVQYVSSEVTGYQDLDNAGTWQTVPNYGPVWTPTSVPAEWVPYHSGHWAWVAPWGWTWIDDQPWGFAPFHYGRWAQVNQRWAWVPGSIVQRPVYAPALVAFIGGGFGGPGVRVGIGLGGVSASIGWLPLAPNEVYNPPYQHSLNYVRNVNNGTINRNQITNINNVTVNKTVNNYANASAAAAMPQSAFTSAQPVQKAAFSLPARMRTAQATTNLSAVQPTALSRVAALPASAHATTAATPATAPGPTAQQEHQEAQTVEHAEPKSLSTAGVQQAHPAETKAPANEQGAVTPAGKPTENGTAKPEQATAEHPAAEAMANHPAAEEKATAEHPAADAAANHPAAEEKATAEAAAHEKPAHEAGTPAPGPSIKGERQPVPLRQQQLSASLAAQKKVPAPPAAETGGTSHKAAPVPQPHPAATQQAAFKPAEVAHPTQSAPLKATPQGWHRQAPAEAKPEAAGEKKDEDKK